uniref:Uncharacterized protein n=1 Tax=viral metagenome TaxID=1070528 RepID=A0A6M3KCP8_9ZZZZ
MRAKIILHIEGNKEAIETVYFEITHGNSMKAAYSEYKNHKMIETKAEVYRTELEEVKSDGS